MYQLLNAIKIMRVIQKVQNLTKIVDLLYSFFNESHLHWN